MDENRHSVWPNNTREVRVMWKTYTTSLLATNDNLARKWV